MRMLLIAAASLALTACTTTSGTSGSDTIARAQAYARAACQFLPTAETVADIIKAGDARLSTAKAIADAICLAINPQAPGNASALLTRVAPAVDGVPIKGQHVGS